MNVNIDQNIQSQIPPQGEQMPPFAPMPPQMGMPMRPRRRITWRERWMHRFGMDSIAAHSLKGELVVPNWITTKSVVFFFLAFAVCIFLFGYPMEFQFALLASMSVLLFFYGSKTASVSWERKRGRSFVRTLFLTALLVRLLWVFYCYFIFNPGFYGTAYGDGADVEWYMPYAKAIAEWITDDNRCSFSKLMKDWGNSIDDSGYPFWLAFVNLITGGESDVFVPFIIKAIISAYCSVCIYHVAKRHFGEGTARIAAIFVTFYPNMIYWCGTMYKETEMVFLCCLCVDLVDKTFTSGRKLTFMSLLPGILSGLGLFFFRAPLAVVIFIAMFAHIVMASNRVMSIGKKVLAGIMVVGALMMGMGERLRMQTERIVDTVQSDDQKNNMEWRSKRDGGNDFARYAGVAVFAPLIFTIPFPSFNVALEGQVLQRMLSGGSYIKNVLSFFVIVVLLLLLISGEWRRHVFIIAYTCGYLASLVLSTFAQSGRFHMPVIPFLLLFAAYGIQIAKKNGRIKRWYTMVLVAEVLICIVWNWFKLAGRGMV